MLLTKGQAESSLWLKPDILNWKELTDSIDCQCILNAIGSEYIVLFIYKFS